MLEKCLMAAQEIAEKRPASAEKYTGAASISAIFNPYTATWEVAASWSCATTIRVDHINLTIASQDLLSLLKGIV
jgi:hypothetical protein